MNKINVLFLIDELVGGGAEAALRNLVNHMDPESFSITVLTLHHTPREGWLAPHIRYKAINRRGSPLVDIGLRLGMKMGWAYPLVIREKYDVEIAFLECFPTRLLAGSTNKDGVKLAWVHCDLAKKHLRPSYFFAYRSFDRVVCVSRPVQERFAELADREADILENVVDEQEIREKARLFRPERSERFTFAAVGRLSPEKGFDRLVSAARRLEAEGFCFTLWLLGDGPERQNLEKAAGKHVAFLGFQENPYPYMAAADALILPSRTEGSSTVAVEAMILGKPMAAADCPGMADLLEGCGLLTQSSEAGIYRGMKQLLTDAALRERLGAAAKDRGSRISKEKSVRQAEAYLLRALEEKRGCPWKFT